MGIYVTVHISSLAIIWRKCIFTPKIIELWQDKAYHLQSQMMNGLKPKSIVMNEYSSKSELINDLIRQSRATLTY